METAIVPTLGPDGWAVTPSKKFDYMLADFFTAEYSADYQFKGNISSITWIVQQTQGNMTDACSLLQRTLVSYLSRAFNNVVVDVAEVETEEQMVGKIRCFIQVTSQDGTATLNAAKLIHTENSAIKSILDEQGATT